jgi:hypothetical protein
LKIVSRIDVWKLWAILEDVSLCKEIMSVQLLRRRDSSLHLVSSRNSKEIIQSFSLELINVDLLRRSTLSLDRVRASGLIGGKLFSLSHIREDVNTI